MADATAAPVTAPEADTTATASRQSSRSAGRDRAIARMQAEKATAAVAPAEAPKPAEPAPVVAKPAEPEKPDPATARGLAAVEQAKKKFLDEQNAAKAELEVQRAEIARLRKEAEGKVTSKAELKKLSPTELLDALDHFTEDDFDILSRAGYARTKAGKTDPRAQAAAQEASRSMGATAAAKAAANEIAELKEELKALKEQVGGEFTRRDQASFAERWVGEAVKAIPADKPTFLSKLHANEPDTAKRELLLIGAELEKANDGNPPTQAEVIEEFEKRQAAKLKSMGFDPAAMLAPAKPAAPPPKPVTRTLDVAATTITRPENAPKTRDEKREAFWNKLHASKRTTADQA